MSDRPFVPADLDEVTAWLKDRPRSARVHLLPHRTEAPMSTTAGILLDAIGDTAGPQP
jgi:hypothetical protein